MTCVSIEIIEKMILKLVKKAAYFISSLRGVRGKASSAM